MYKNILVPVVFGGDQKNFASIDVARALAAEGAKFTVMHVIESMPNYATSQIPTDVLDRVRAEIEKSLSDAAKALPGAKTQLISGHAGSTIIEYANETNVNCIVMASHRPEFSDLFLGSTAARVVRHANCAVHVIR